MTDTTIKISKETHEFLKGKGKYGESMDSILRRLLKLDN